MEHGSNLAEGMIWWYRSSLGSESKGDLCGLIGAISHIQIVGPLAGRSAVSDLGLQVTCLWCVLSFVNYTLE